MNKVANHRQLWFLPLGGTGEIGMNMNLYSHDDQWLMVDCGQSFDEPLKAPYLQNHAELEAVKHFDRVAADPNFISDQKENLAGLIITHAHEDHLGAVVDVWPRLRCPVYTTKFTAVCLRKKLAEKRIQDDVTIIEVDSGSTINIGVFEVQWLALTHSLPEPHGLVIRTRAGSVFHTGDWKIDHNPVIGDPFDARPFKQLAQEGIDAMVCDSTNALKAGHTQSEGACYKGLLRHIENAEGRVVVCCFGSNIARLVSLAKIAKKTNRYMGLLGRSLRTMVNNAKIADYWPFEYPISEPQELAYLPKDETLLVATGSQGEARAALGRLAAGTHPEIEIEAGDTVIFSSIVIPGNELAVESLIQKLKIKNINVITPKTTDLVIHASGHPNQGDLADLYDWVKPKVAIPTHGEPEHLQTHGLLAKKLGVPRQLTGLNGDLFELGEFVKVRKQFAKVGRIPLS